MAATSTNNIWEKCEIAMVRFITDTSIGINASNLYKGHDNAQKQVPHIVCECHDWDPETPGNPTGNWFCQCRVTITTKLFDETGEDNSGRFASITDAFLDDNTAANLSSAPEFFTCFLCLPAPGTKRIQGDELVVEQNFTLVCCGSVIA